MRSERYIGSVLAVVLLATPLALANESPHWNKATCDTCHVVASPVAGNSALRHAVAEIGCMECHGDRGGMLACRHRSDLPIGDLAVPEYYSAALDGDRVTCTTCHDLTFQCKNPNVAYSFQNPGFLRNRVSHDTTDQCFECHDDERYAALNPHAGAIEDPLESTCRLCHVGDAKPASSGMSDIAFNMPYDPNDMCLGCHDVRPHPKGMSFGASQEGWVHLVRPSADVLVKMERWEAATGKRLPLSAHDGKVYCATCHDPHGPAAGSAVLQAEDRLRSDDICQACHEK